MFICILIDCPGACRKIYKPVCGSDGKTYGNACSLDNKRRCEPGNDDLQIAHEGKCEGMDVFL